LTASCASIFCSDPRAIVTSLAFLTSQTIRKGRSTSCAGGTAQQAAGCGRARRLQAAGRAAESGRIAARRPAGRDGTASCGLARGTGDGGGGGGSRAPTGPDLGAPDCRHARALLGHGSQPEQRPLRGLLDLGQVVAGQPSRQLLGQAVVAPRLGRQLPQVVLQDFDEGLH
jgi:hypothetical protein